mgnify:CR=1 FL=1
MASPEVADAGYAAGIDLACRPTFELQQPIGPDAFGAAPTLLNSKLAGYKLAGDFVVILTVCTSVSVSL